MSFVGRSLYRLVWLPTANILRGSHKLLVVGRPEAAGSFLFWANVAEAEAGARWCFDAHPLASAPFLSAMTRLDRGIRDANESSGHRGSCASRLFGLVFRKFMADILQSLYSRLFLRIAKRPSFLLEFLFKIEGIFIPVTKEDNCPNPCIRFT